MDAPLARAQSRSWLLAPLAGFGTGAFVALNRLAEQAHLPSRPSMLLAVIASAAAGAGVFGLGQRFVGAMLIRRLAQEAAREAVRRWHAATWLVFTLSALGAVGLRLPGLLGPLALIGAFALLNLALILGSGSGARDHVFGSAQWLGFLFFLSGMAALVYQVTWQRALFASFGVNIESVTVVVTLFMFGLGVGAVFGGFLSRRYPDALPRLFLLSELGVGGFGLISLPLIRGVGSQMIRSDPAVTGLAIWGLLAVPTLMMGATLPILVAHLHQRLQHVGRAVGALYFVNTLGSAVASYLTARLLFVLGGQQSAVWCAAALNFAVGALAWRTMTAIKAPAVPEANS
jgi:hypothetical protein